MPSLLADNSVQNLKDPSELLCTRSATGLNLLHFRSGPRPLVKVHQHTENKGRKK